MVNVGVAYSNQFKQVWLKIDLPDGSTVIDAIHESGVLDIFPEIDLDKQKIGIYGKITKPDVKLKEGDRVEIYRQITADPKTVKRRDQDEDED